MQIGTDTEVRLFIPHRASGRLVFNPKAIEVLGLNPAELAQRGYPLDVDDPAPATAIETTRSRRA
jgi:hypothetical protein